MFWSIEEISWISQWKKKKDLKTYDNARKIATGQGDDYTTECLLDHPYFEKHYKALHMTYYNHHPPYTGGILLQRLCVSFVRNKFAH